MSSHAIGIDLGTTFSTVAHVNQHSVRRFFQYMDRITPSVIYSIKIIIGLEAKNAVAYVDRLYNL